MIETVGFTGTARGMRNAQSLRVTQLLLRLKPKKARHGMCIGADEQFHKLCKAAGIYVIGHPGVTLQGKVYKRAKEIEFCDLVLPPKQFLLRNHDMVKESDVLIATPKGFEEEVRSGTWATIRYAQSIGRPYYIVWPDGEVYYRQ